MSTPVVTALRAIPVAGRDSMLLNLSGAHGPFFTRNLLVLTDSAGRTGVGEVPGGEKIRQTLEDAAAGGRPAHRRALQGAATRAAWPLPTATAAAAGCRPSTCAPPSTP
jgi:glucarate dehydratase